ncbi:MAG: cytochrome P450 [Gammaproteobacteria bacterium]|nr:cytochrome P450 [Gammaproteobacteria bacterium]
MFKGRITNAPHVPRWRALLDTRHMIRNPLEVFERYRARLGDTFTFHFGGTRPTIVSSDPDFIEHVLKGNRDNYQKSDIQVERMVEFQGKGLVNSHGDEWLRRRRVLARGFLPARLAQQLPVQQEVLRDLMSAFDSAVRRGPVDMHQQMVRFTLRLIGNALFGRSMRGDELDLIADSISEIQAFIVRQIIRPYMIPWYRISGISRRYQRMRATGDEIVLRHIAARRAEGVGESDFLRLMLETPYHDSGRTMTEDEVRVESLQLMVAGNETSSISLTWIFYLLGRHPQYIARIRAEIAELIGDDDVDFDKLHRLELTTRVIDEALRLYPPFWTIDRVAMQSDEIGGIRIPQGTIVLPYIYGAHHNAARWPEPERFDPDRFLPEQSGERHRFAYLPFGGGPRLCIGQNMAIVTILLIIATVVRRYDFELATDVPVGKRPMMLLRPDGPVHMRFRLREEQAR